MGELLRLKDKKTQLLRSRHLVGRSRICDLQLEDRRVSGEHAIFRWTAEGWQVRDLGSTNGTWIDGKRLHAGRTAKVGRGMRIGFGSEDASWELASDDAPALFATCGNQLVRAIGETLFLPASDDPEVLVARGEHGVWVVETHGEVEPIDGEFVAAGGEAWRLHLPEALAMTLDHDAGTITLDQTALRFEVKGRELIRVVVSTLADEIDLGAARHFQLLLELARARADDAEKPRDEQGWRHQDTVTASMGIDDGQLYVLSHRARKALAEAGVFNPARTVQRRRHRELRLGVPDVEIREI